MQHGADFTGGKFAFLKPAPGRVAVGDDAGVLAALAEGDVSAWEAEHVVEPAAGRLLLFTAGLENVHHVQRVETGTRCVRLRVCGGRGK